MRASILAAQTLARLVLQLWSIAVLALQADLALRKARASLTSPW